MNWKTTRAEQLVQAFLSLRTRDEVRAYLRDLLTEAEIDDFAKRFETARLLSLKTSYPSIQKSTGFSTTTIARVSKWLQTGKGGYSLVLNRLHHTPDLVERGMC